jgi:methylmalonyl-CoA/ethylmalonyl-CoA epimerase
VPRSVAHIGIAVKDLEQSIDLFSRLLGVSPEHREEVADQKVNTAMFSFGDTAIELLEPTSSESTIARFIEKRGEGMHHVSLVVDDIAKELERLKREGFQLIDERPRKGADNCLVAFVHPKSANGVLIELSQKIR